MLLFLLACSRPDPASPASITRWTLDNGARIVVQTTLDGDELVAAWSESDAPFSSSAEVVAASLALSSGNSIEVGTGARAYADELGGTVPLPLGSFADVDAGGATITCRARVWGTVSCANTIVGRFLHPTAKPNLDGLPADHPLLAAINRVGARAKGYLITPSDIQEARDAWTTEGAIARQRATFSDAGQFVFAFVGPLPAWALKPAIDATIGALPGTPADPPPLPAVVMLPATGPAEVPAGGEGRLFRDWSSPCGFDAADSVAFRAVVAAATDAVGHRARISASQTRGVCSVMMQVHTGERAAADAALAALSTGDLEAFRDRIGRAPRAGDSLAWAERLRDVEVGGAPADWLAQHRGEAARFDQAALDRARARFLAPEGFSEVFCRRG